ncbi:hypothetical protein Lal_00019805 [Lupinus albus]|nr:hypothetical protein Lal_00019805 [Lupinus albus]
MSMNVGSYLLFCIHNSHLFQFSMDLTSLNGVNKSNFNLGAYHKLLELVNIAIMRKTLEQKKV